MPRRSVSTYSSNTKLSMRCGKAGPSHARPAGPCHGATPLLRLDLLVKLDGLNVLVALHGAHGVLGEFNTGMVQNGSV